MRQRDDGNWAPAQRGIMVYMTRRVIAFQIVLSLLAAFLITPAAPTLVCRTTGQLMTPVAATPATRHSCCAVVVTTPADGERYALTSPGCCDLRFTSRGTAPIAATNATPNLPALAIWAPAPPTLCALLIEVITTPPSAERQDAPRAPPSQAASPRAPPSLS
jgi:hypothetical protein